MGGCGKGGNWAPSTRETEMGSSDVRDCSDEQAEFGEKGMRSVGGAMMTPRLPMGSNGQVEKQALLAEVEVG